MRDGVVVRWCGDSPPVDERVKTPHSEVSPESGGLAARPVGAVKPQRAKHTLPTHRSAPMSMKDSRAVVDGCGDSPPVCESGRRLMAQPRQIRAVWGAGDER